MRQKKRKKVFSEKSWSRTDLKVTILVSASAHAAVWSNKNTHMPNQRQSLPHYREVRLGRLGSGGGSTQIFDFRKSGNNTFWMLFFTCNIIIIISAL